MNTTLSTQGRQETSVHQQHSPPVRRVGLVDRAALHLGVALIKWGRRPGVQPGHERRANRLELALVRAQRDAHVALHRDQLAQDYALMLRVR